MEISKTAEEGKLSLAVMGRLETVTAPQLESEITSLSESVLDLTLDFSALEYVSSAGLRVILMAQKKMAARKGRMTLAHVNAAVKKVFDITGFSSILTFA